MLIDTLTFYSILSMYHSSYLQVKVLRELCDKLSIPHTSKHAKLDIIKKLKQRLEIPSEFVKVFSKFWGGSGETRLARK